MVQGPPNAQRLDAVDFITDRDDLTGTLSCGERAALDAVIATVRLSAAAAPHVGTAIAEFVAKGYVPTRQCPRQGEDRCRDKS